MPNLFDLTGKVALVTGASRGLGQQFARVLAEAGADLAITSRTRASLEPFAAEMRALGRRVACIELNVREQPSIENAVAAALAELGQIDILINNAGCNIRKRAVEVTWEDWNTILDTNLRGIFFVAQAVARHMIERRAGRIVNIGSVTCVAGYAGLGPYGASRGGVKQLTMSLAHDWGEYGITVNCLAPGWFKTAAEPRALRKRGLGRLSVRTNPARPPRRNRRPRRRALTARLRRRPLHHRPNAARRWRHLCRRRSRIAKT